MNLFKRSMVLALLSVCALPALARQKEYTGRIDIKPLALEQTGDSLRVRIVYDISGVNVESRREIELVPVLVAPQRTLRMPSVVVRGRNSYKSYRRDMALMGRKERAHYAPVAPYAVVPGYKARSARQVEYTRIIPYESWMADARLDLREEVGGCGVPPRMLSVSQLVGSVTLEKVWEPYIVVPHLAYVRPAVEPVKRREAVAEAFLDFRVSKTNIEPDYMNNPVELKKITDMIGEAKSDPDITVKSIRVAGYASPEGSYALNRRLSEGRAAALASYIAPRSGYPRSMFQVEFGGENWQGLRDRVELADMPWTDDVLAILDFTYSDEIRKEQLRKLNGGGPYRFMLREFYPYLRKAVCKVDYEVRGFDADRAKELIFVRPQNLSLSEMFLAANTYGQGSKQFIDVFEMAVRMFPEDGTANLNAASAALARGDTVTAVGYLARATRGIPEYENAKGVLLMLKGEYDKAEACFEAAAGLDAARLNRTEITRKKENILTKSMSR